MLSLSKLRKKMKKQRQQRALLMAYAIIVTIALIISVYNNNNVNASVNNKEPIDYFDSQQQAAVIDPEAEAIEEAQESVPDGDIDSMFDTASTTSNITTEQMEIEVKSGDTFISILTNLGLEYKKANDIYLEMKKVYNIAKELRVGKKLQIVVVKDEMENKLINVDKVLIEPTVGTRYIVERDEDDKYVSKKEQDEFATEVKRVKGKINGALYATMQNAGVPRNVTADFTNIFSFSVDFSRDVKAGDEFEVLYEAEVAPDGKVVKNGDVLYAGLQLGKQKMAMYRFKDASGRTEYYDEKGQALKKTLDKKPLSLKRARISSPFGWRKHPILKVRKLHSGVDYAAPYGTLVYAAGDGVVQMAKYNGGYGNFIKIRHNSEYSTGYVHMNSFAKGIRPGVRVKQGQVIGYVGSTGRSTGPHLHYEIIRNGQKIDPLRVKAATGENLSGKNLQQFKTIVASIEEMKNPKPEQQEENVASTENTQETNNPQN